MTIKKLTPYLFCNGNAEEAIRHYEEALGAKREGLLRWGEHPGACPDGMKGKVMHAALHVGDALLMMSDSPAGKAAVGASVAVEVHDAEEMAKSFDLLAAKGKVVDAIHDAFWGDKFGVVEDAYGTVWMFTCPGSAEGAKS